jgi:hypothetical protein
VSHEIVLKSPSIAPRLTPILSARNRSTRQILLRKIDRKSTIDRAQALFPPLYVPWTLLDGLFVAPIVAR